MLAPNQGAIIANQGAVIANQGAVIPNQGAVIANQAAAIANQAAAIQPQGLLNLPQMVANVMSSDTTQHQAATTYLRQLLSRQDNPPIQEVINTGVIPRLIEFLQCHTKPPLQFEAAWAITNIVSGTSDHALAVIEAGAIPIFVQLLSSPTCNADVREQAVWALGNIAGDSPKTRDMTLKAGVLQPLLAQLHRNNKLSMLRIGTWTLSNLCRGKPQPKFELVSPALITLGQLIFQLDDEILADACWALSYLSDGKNEQIAAVIESGVTMRLVELLMHPSTAIQTPALRAVGNIVTGDDLQTQTVINCSALPCLKSMLSSVKYGIVQESCWAISNITAGNNSQIQNVIDNSIIPKVIHLVSHSDKKVRKEAVWVITNGLAGGTSKQLEHYVDNGCISPLCNLLTMKSDPLIDQKCISNIYDGLESIVTKLNGYLILMAIKRIAPKMYTFRSVLLEMFFGIELCNNFGKFTTNSNNIEEKVRLRLLKQAKSVCQKKIVVSPYICSYTGTFNKNRCYIKNKSRPVVVDKRRHNNMDYADGIYLEN